MPKEDLRTSSKKAKDKSNSAALLALREDKDTDDSSARDSHCSSEKDSGYSDNGSDWHQADVEDQQHNSVSQPSPGARGHGPAPSPGQSHGRGQEDRAETPNPVMMPGSGEVRPVYILKNMLVKQQEMIQDGGDHIQTKLIWGNGGGNTSTNAASHVILLQQPSAIPNLPVSEGLHKPPTRKNSGTGRKSNGTYLPILNSYPRIAPHPAKKPSDKASQDSQSQSKRICTEDQRVRNVSTLKGLLEKHLREPHSVTCSSEVPGTSVPVGDSCAHLSPAAVSSSLGSQTISSPDDASLASPRQHSHLSSILAARKGCGLLNSLLNSHHRRFVNTIEILSQSGLLDITMRTRELLRQSNTTDREIAQLRQHTRLLCQAASNPNGGPDGDEAWAKVHKAMAQSGRYSSVTDLRSEQNSSDNNPHSGDSDSDSSAVGDANVVFADRNRAAPSLPLHTPPLNLKQTCPVQEHSSVNISNTMSDAEQGEKHREVNREQSEKVTIVPPDSSTGGDVC